MADETTPETLITICGTVVRPDGKLIVDASVQPVRWDGHQGEIFGCGERCHVDNQGRFTVQVAERVLMHDHEPKSATGEPCARYALLCLCQDRTYRECNGLVPVSTDRQIAVRIVVDNKWKRPQVTLMC
jgi:hypothetical protein